MAKNDAPIIVILRVKKAGHGHHGGAGPEPAMG